ncbi:hypothetical protein [Vibrio splendidus]|uniref:hypothetical protein n=1 Tax=Vibrio splendidus TaxID=29497 RepID=UPI00076A731F|nr:hypothetical protein [Vibrio splendidus]PHX06113.1 hypothetical protein VSPL_25740 [Vibrio splendidus]
MKQYQKYLSLLLVLVAFNSNALQCGAGKVEVDGVCVSSCKILEGTGKNLTWDAYIWGDNPRSYCIGDRSTGAACRMTAGSVSISVEGNKWTNKFTYTGSTCAFDEINRFSGDTPEPFPFENDVNQNGVNDDLEDWDGDGTPNGEDPDPYKSDRVVVDDNDNGVPDSIDDFYDRLSDVNEPVGCNTDDEDCRSYRYTIKHLTENNRDLAGALRDLSLRSVRRTDFRESIGSLVSTINKNDGYFKSKLDALSLAQGNTQSSILNQLSDTKYSLKSAIEGGFFVVNRNLDDIKDDVFRARQSSGEAASNSRYVMGQTDDIKNDLSEVYRRTAEIINKLNTDGSGGDGSGLTPSQIKQLKNAAKAHLNNKLLKEQKNSIDGVNYGLGEVYELALAQGEKLNQLDSKISSISGGSSTVDLTSLETGLQSLSDKIDGLDTSDMSGVESKLTDLIDGVTNNNNFVEPNYGFDGEGFIVTQNQIAEVQNEVLEIKQEMTDEFEKFKALFSIDTSSFNNGTYKEHSLNLNVNHAERSFKSGVLSALLDNATLISAVVMFLFVLSGIRMLGKD